MSPAYADLHSSGPTSMTPEGFFQGLKLSRVNRATIKMFSAKGKDGKSQKVKCLLLLLLPLQLLFSGRLRQLCHVCQLWREVGLGEIGPGLWQPLTGPCKRKRFFDEKDLADKALKILQGEKIQKMSPSTRKMMQREMDERKQKLAAEDKK